MRNFFIAILFFFSNGSAIAYKPPCERNLGGVIKPPVASSEDQKKARDAFYERALFPKPDFPESVSLILKTAASVCEARGILTTAFVNEEGQDELVITPILGVSRLNDFAFFQHRLFSVRTTFCPRFLIEHPNTAAAFSRHKNTIYLSSRSLGEGRPDEDAYHEGDHARLWKNLENGMFSVYQGLLGDGATQQSYQEYATIPRQLYREALRWRTVIRNKRSDSEEDKKARFRASAYLLGSLMDAREAISGLATGIRTLSEEALFFPEYKRETLKDGRHYLFWAKIVLEGGTFRFPVWRDTRPDPELKGAGAAVQRHISLLVRINCEFENKLNLLDALITPADFDMRKLFSRHEDVQKRATARFQAFVDSISLPAVEEIVDILHIWHNQIEVRMVKRVPAL